MKKRIIRVLNSSWFGYLVLFLALLLVHQFFYFSNDDTTYFSNILDTMSWSNFLKMRYYTWTSRIIIEGLLVVVSRNIYLWRLLDSLVICLLVYSIQKILIKNYRVKDFFVILIILLIYPFSNMKQAGFCATTLNYLWPLTFFLFSLVPFFEREEKKFKFMYLFYILAFVYACNQEQVVCVALVVSFIMLIDAMKRKQKIKYPFILFLISSISLIFILTCPGNTLRSITEANTWYVQYQNTNFFDKIYLGISSTVSIFFEVILVILICSFMLFFSAMKELQRRKVKMIAFLQFLVILGLSCIRMFELLFHKRYLFFHYVTDLGHPFQGSLLNFTFLTLGIGIILVFCYLLFELFDKKSWYLILALLLGCGTRVMMGFSPTVFASDSRTMIFLDFSLIGIILFIWFHYKDYYKKKDKLCLLSMIAFCGMANLVFLLIDI